MATEMIVSSATPDVSVTRLRSGLSETTSLLDQNTPAGPRKHILLEL